jgi:hypothetical protein
LAANKSAAPAQKPGFSIPPAAIVIALVLIVGAAAFLYLNRAAQKPPEPPAPLTGDARTYIHNGFLPIKDVDMQAHESYLKQQIVEITGKIGNNGNRVVQNAQIYCVFLDSYGQIVLRERVAIVKQKLSPGEMQNFRLAFDNIPASWNQAMPTIVIASIDFAGA